MPPVASLDPSLPKSLAILDSRSSHIHDEEASQEESYLPYCSSHQGHVSRKITRQIFHNYVVPGKSRGEAKEFYEEHVMSLKLGACDISFDDIWCALMGMVVMDGQNPACMHVVETYQGRLESVDPEFAHEMRNLMPDTPAARVADFNENIAYCFLDRRGIRSMINEHYGVLDEERHKGVKSFEDCLKKTLDSDSIEYQGSFLKTEETIPQPAHVDYKWEYLQEHNHGTHIGFFPLTKEGMVLQFWKNSLPSHSEEGTLVYIPFGKLLLVPAATVHGGGFRTSTCGNPRFHLYVASKRNRLPAHQQNKYTEQHDKTRELCDRLTDSPSLNILLESFFEP